MTIPAMPEVLPTRLGRRSSWLTQESRVGAPKAMRPLTRRLLLGLPTGHGHCAGVDETGHRCECLGRDA